MENCNKCGREHASCISCYDAGFQAAFAYVREMVSEKVGTGFSCRFGGFCPDKTTDNKCLREENCNMKKV